MAGDSDDSRDDGERTRIGGMSPPALKRPEQPAAPEKPEGEGERTVIAPARPPAAPGAAAPAAPEKPEGEGERTVIAPARPPATPGAASSAAPEPAKPAAPPPADDAGGRTRVVSAPPPGAPRATPAPPPPASAPSTPASAAPPAAPAAPAPPAAPAGEEEVTSRGATGETEEQTVVLARHFQTSVRLRRVAPSGQAEVVTLDRPNLVLGRGHAADIKLYTSTASREHARLWFQDGAWMILAIDGKSLVVDGKRAIDDAVELKHEMQLLLGDDQFVVQDESGARPVKQRRGLLAWLRGLFSFGKRS